LRYSFLRTRSALQYDTTVMVRTPNVRKKIEQVRENTPTEDTAKNPVAETGGREEDTAEIVAREVRDTARGVPHTVELPLMIGAKTLAMLKVMGRAASIRERA